MQSLADSRFDWERVMRELALILPSDVWLVNLTATATPGVDVGGGSGGGGSSSGGGMREQVAGPALELSGCAAGQTSVAGFVTALEDIDGVTRVGVQSSQLADKESGAGSSSGGGGGSGSGDDCRTRDFIAKFEIVVAFDAAPVAAAAGEGEAAPESAPEAAQVASNETSEGSGEGGEAAEMDALKKAGTVPLVALLAVVVLAIVFWLLLLGPKREEAAKLGDEIATVESSLAQHRAEVATAEEARASFATDYQKLVVLGKAVPGSSETPSLLVQVSGIAERTGVEFKDIELSSAGGGGEASSAPTTAAGGQPVSATEATASLLPLGASVGPAGLAAMPYTLTFNGSFFKVADFIERLDALVKTPREEVVVDGRLLTIDGFSLAAGPNGFPSLTASFAVTSYVTPPDQGDDGRRDAGQPDRLGSNARGGEARRRAMKRPLAEDARAEGTGLRSPTSSTTCATAGCCCRSHWW